LLGIHIRGIENRRVRRTVTPLTVHECVWTKVNVWRRSPNPGHGHPAAGWVFYVRQSSVRRRMFPRRKNYPQQRRSSEMCPVSWSYRRFVRAKPATNPRGPNYLANWSCGTPAKQTHQFRHLLFKRSDRRDGGIAARGDILLAIACNVGTRSSRGGMDLPRQRLAKQCPQMFFGS